jgi:hypothetical protein
VAGESEGRDPGGGSVACVLGVGWKGDAFPPLAQKSRLVTRTCLTQTGASPSLDLFLTPFPLDLPTPTRPPTPAHPRPRHTTTENQSLYELQSMFLDTLCHFFWEGEKC